MTARNDVSRSNGQFLNVDLDVHSRRPLDAFVEGLGRAVTVMYVGRAGRRYSAHLELGASGYGQSSDWIIRRFVTLIQRLGPAAQEAWAGASARIFDVGIKAGHALPPYRVSLKPATVAAIASVGATLAITVYAPE